MIRWLVSRSTLQYGLVTALLAVLAYGLLAPGGDVRAMGVVATATLGTPSASGTPAPTRPIMPTSTATATASRTPYRSSPVASPGSPVAATPQAASPTSAALPALSGTAVPTPAVSPSVTPATVTTPILTPTPLASAALGATIVSDLSPLSFTLNGQNQVAPSSMSIGVSDASAPAQQTGWQLTLTMEQFRVAGTPSRALPRNAVSLVGVSVACAQGATCTAPQNSLAYPIELPAGEVVTIFEAAPGTGRGQFVVTVTFAIRVPATAYAGSYSTTIVPGVAREGGASFAPAGATATTPPRATPAGSAPPQPATATASASHPLLTPTASAIRPRAPNAASPTPAASR